MPNAMDGVLNGRTCGGTSGITHLRFPEAPSSPATP